MDFIERLSATLFNKQILHKQSEDVYYNRYDCYYYNREEAEDFIINCIYEINKKIKGELLWLKSIRYSIEIINKVK